MRESAAAGSCGCAWPPALAGVNDNGVLTLVFAEIGLDDFGIGTNFRRGAVGNLAAVIEHDNVIRDAHYNAHIVLYQKDTDLLSITHGKQKFVERGGFARVEAGGRLVQAQKGRARAQ